MHCNDTAASVAASHSATCLAPAIAEAVRQHLSDRIGVSAQDPEFDAEPAVAWGLDSLDFLTLIEAIERSFGQELTFPKADLHTVNLSQLADAMATQTCPPQRQ